MEDIYLHVLFFFICNTLEGQTTRREIFSVLNYFFMGNGLRWKFCSSVCTGPVASMGCVEGLLVQIKMKSPTVQTHCIMHRGTLISKKMSPGLHVVLSDAVKIINFIKSRPIDAGFVYYINP